MYGNNRQQEPRVTYARRVPALSYEQVKEREFLAAVHRDSELVHELQAQCTEYRSESEAIYVLQVLIAVLLATTLGFGAFWPWIQIFRPHLASPDTWLFALFYVFLLLIFVYSLCAPTFWDLISSLLSSYTLVLTVCVLKPPRPIIGELSDRLMQSVQESALCFTTWFVCTTMCLILAGVYCCLKDDAHHSNDIAIRLLHVQERVQRMLDFSQEAHTLEQALPRDLTQLQMDYHPEYSRYVSDPRQRFNNNLAYRRYGFIPEAAPLQ